MNRLGRYFGIAAAAAILAGLVSCSAISQYLGLSSLSPPSGGSSGQSNPPPSGGGTTTSSGLSVVLSTSVKGSTATSPIPVTVQFSSPVTDFALASLSITGGSAATLTATSSAEYQVAVVPSGNTTVSVSLPAGVVQNSSGAKNDASNQLSVAFSEPLPAVAFSNVANNGLLETSLLLGKASGTNGVSGVEISLDGGTAVKASGTTSWSFRLPTGASAWKYHTTHTLTIRSYDVTGNFSQPVTISLRKGNNEDLNGDGYPDLVVGAPALSSGGAVYVFYGSQAGFSGNVPATGASVTLTGSAGDCFGTAIAVGDLNGDGYADVAVGAPGASSGAGAVDVYYGSASGLSSTPQTILNGEAGSALGGDLAIGDLNTQSYPSDGYADLGVTAAGNGHAYVFYGTPTGIPSAYVTTGGAFTDFSSGTTIPVGNEIAFGDVNGDGNLDIAIGGANSAGDGSVAVITGTASMTTGPESITTNSMGLSIDTITEEATGQAFGASPIAFGDFNGDGIDDLAVGAADYSASSTGEGRVYLFDGGPAAFSGSAPILATSASTIITGPAGSNLGARIAVGRVDADSCDDLLLGATDAAGSQQGHVYLVYGSAAGIPNTDITTAAPANIAFFAGPAGSTLFGTMPRQVLDLNGDGFADLVFGAPGAASGAGELFLFDGSSAGFSSVDLSATPSAATATISGAAGSNLGVGLN